MSQRASELEGPFLTGKALLISALVAAIAAALLFASASGVFVPSQPAIEVACQPKGWLPWDTIPAYPGANGVEEVDQPDPKIEFQFQGEHITVTRIRRFQTSDSPAKINAFYLGRLSELGWIDESAIGPRNDLFFSWNNTKTPPLCTPIGQPKIAGPTPTRDLFYLPLPVPILKVQMKSIGNGSTAVEIWYGDYPIV